MFNFKLIIKIAISITFTLSISYVFLVFAGNNSSSGDGNMLINGNNNSGNTVNNNFYQSTQKQPKKNAIVIKKPVSYLFRNNNFDEMIKGKNIQCQFQINDTVELLSDFAGTPVRTAKAKVLTGKCKGQIGLITPDSI